MTYKKVYTQGGCAPAPAKLADILQRIHSRAGCNYTSIYRGEDAKTMLHQCGKRTQAEVYAELGPGIANPPGRSTHELRNDGVAYRWWPLFFRIPWWACGVDVFNSDVQSFIREARKEGLLATITYPNSPVEYHHVNFRKAPKVQIFPTLRKGHKNPFNIEVVNGLIFLKYLHSPVGFSHMVFNDKVEAALKRFQSDYHLHVDGVYGPHARYVMKTAIRNRKRHL